MNLHSAPEMNTSFTEPLALLEERFLSHSKSIKEWFEEQWRLTVPPIYGSVDLRNAGFKLAPIDMNLFPAGFNNLNSSFLSISVNAAKKSVEQIKPDTRRILIIPEGHTRNLYYWANVKTLQNMFEKAGYEVKLACLPDDETPEKILLKEGEPIFIFPLKRKDTTLFVDSSFVPDLVLLNNDLSNGIPDILQGVLQPIVPPAELGWSQRLKSEHFHYYSQVSAEFAKQINVDPWLLAPLFEHCGEIDFQQPDGLKCVIEHGEKLFSEIKKKYDEYHLPYQPFLIVKADAGTYGMAVMTVRHLDELKSMNRKQRTRMAMTKGGQPVNRVIIQEGIYSFETIGPDKAVAEPVVYLIGQTVVGGFYRLHRKRGVDENLNSPGMYFEPIAFNEPCHEPSHGKHMNACQNLFYTYGIIAQLSMLAAAREMKDQNKKAL